MKILRVFNNNVVLARQGDREVIVTGRGIGFQAKQGQQVDADKIGKVFVPADGRDPDHLAAMLAEIPGRYIRIVTESLAESGVEAERQEKLTLVVALADHISAAIDRAQHGNFIEYPLKAEVQHLYAEDFALAGRLFAAVNARLDVPLPEQEVVALTLHLVNAGFTSGDLSYTYTMTGLIQQILSIVGGFYKRELDTSEVSVGRFITHLRYLFVRLQNTNQLDGEHTAVGEAIMASYPDAAECARTLATIIELRFDQVLSDDEVAYLALHIARLSNQL